MRIWPRRSFPCQSSAHNFYKITAERSAKLKKHSTHRILSGGTVLFVIGSFIAAILVRLKKRFGEFLPDNLILARKKPPDPPEAAKKSDPLAISSNDGDPFLPPIAAHLHHSQSALR